MWGSDDPVRVVSDRLLCCIPCAEAHGYSPYALRAKTFSERWFNNFEVFAARN